MLVSLTVGKVDAGVAVLLTQDNRLIEFPSVLLPKNITSGSIVDIEVSRNHAAEQASIASFQALQKRILHTYGLRTPSPPVLRLRNATQTSLVLEWDPIDLATASLKSLSLYRNGSKAGSIPRPLEMLSTKISGLAIHTEYTFHLVLRTSAGTYQSEKLTCRTHKMTDLSGITVTPGIMPAPVKEALARTLDRIGGKMIDTVRIDTTHFVCTEGRGPLWEKAVEMNIPVVRPEWVDACEAEGTIVSVRGYYLNADPKHRQLGPRPRSQHQHQQPPPTASTTSEPAPPTGSQTTLPSRPGTMEHAAEQPTTPFPGGEQTSAAAGQQNQKEEANKTEKPLPPPPKEDAPEKEESKEKVEEEKKEQDKAEEESKQAEAEEEAKLSEKAAAKENGAARAREGEGEQLDEVPL